MINLDRQEYDWLTDPFDEKKQAEEAEKAHMTRGSKCTMIILASLALPVAYVIFTALAFFLWIIAGADSPRSDALGDVAFALRSLPSGLARLFFHV